MLQWGPAVGSLCINVNYCLADTLGLLLDVNEGQMEAGAVWAALICTLQLFDCFYFIYFIFFSYPFSANQEQQTISSVMELLLLSAELAGLEEHRGVKSRLETGK